VRGLNGRREIRKIEFSCEGDIETVLTSGCGTLFSASEILPVIGGRKVEHDIGTDRYYLEGDMRTFRLVFWQLFLLVYHLFRASVSDIIEELKGI